MIGERARAWVGVAPATVLLAVLFGGALAGAVRQSLQPTLDGALSLEVWREVLADPAFGDALAFTTRVTVGATAASCALALGLTVLLRDRGRLLRGVHSFPVLVPHLVVAIVAVLWLGAGGIADRLLGTLPFALVRDAGGVGIMLVYVAKEVPFLTLLLLTRFTPELAAREEAAALLGAGPWQRLRLVTWPTLRPPLVLGALVVAAFTFGSFEVPQVVGPTYPPTIAVLALDQVRSSALLGPPRASAILLVAAAVSVAAAMLALRQLRHLVR